MVKEVADNWLKPGGKQPQQWPAIEGNYSRKTGVHGLHFKGAVKDIHVLPPQVLATGGCNGR